MANVPNTTTFCLSNVTAVVGGTTLVQAFANATDGRFCATYKGTKTCLTNFRGYCGGQINFSTVSQSGGGTATACACLAVGSTPAMVAGDCYTLCLIGNLSTVQQGTNARACYQVICNGSSIYCCVITGNICTTSISTSLNVCYGNTVNVIIYATTESTSCPSNGSACACISSISNIKGGFERGSTYSCGMSTG